jgi:heme oxygenase
LTPGIVQSARAPAVSQRFVVVERPDSRQPRTGCGDNADMKRNDPAEVLASAAPHPGAIGMQAPGLADRMRSASHALHATAERTGVVAALIRGRGDRPAYLRYLASLRAVYRALEAALERHRDDRILQGLARPEVYRATALDADLAALGGSATPVPEAALRYARHLDALSDTRPALLVAHAYTRYLGDLNGGRLLADRVRNALALPDDALAFHAFPRIDDLPAFAREYRAAIDAVPLDVATAEAVVAEARVAFEHNIALSIAAA